MVGRVALEIAGEAPSAIRYIVASPARRDHPSQLREIDDCMRGEHTSMLGSLKMERKMK